MEFLIPSISIKYSVARFSDLEIRRGRTSAALLLVHKGNVIIRAKCDHWTMQTIESIVSFFVSPQKLVERIVVVVVGDDAVVAMPRLSFSATFRTNSKLGDGIFLIFCRFLRTVKVLRAQSCFACLPFRPTKTSDPFSNFSSSLRHFCTSS